MSSADTFIRCPACRSIVPVETGECRMCGAELENAGPDLPAAEGDEPTVVFDEPTHISCPACGKHVSQIASRCRFCGADLYTECPGSAALSPEGQDVGETQTAAGVRRLFWPAVVLVLLSLFVHQVALYGGAVPAGFALRAHFGSGCQVVRELVQGVENDRIRCGDECLELCLQWCPESIELHAYMGQAALLAGRLEEAEQHLLLALAGGGRTELHARLGRLRMAQRRFAEARRSCEEALRIDAANSEAIECAAALPPEEPASAPDQEQI